MAKNSSNQNDLNEQARELGIDPSAYAGNEDGLKDRIEHVRAERDAVSEGQPDLRETSEQENRETQETNDNGVMSSKNTPNNSSDK